MRLVYALAFARIVRFTVKGANEAGVELVLIQPYLFYYVNQYYVYFRFGGKWNMFRRFVPLENSQKKWKI